MGGVKIRYYVVQKGRAYWQPNAAMEKAGFRRRPLGPPGPDAWAQAETLNAAWDAHRRGEEAKAAEATVSPTSFAGVFKQMRSLDLWQRKKPRTREEWEYAWAILEPVWGSLEMADVDIVLVDRFYKKLRKTYSLHKTHRLMKIFRGLLNFGLKLKVITVDPSESILNTAPSGRTYIWQPEEVELLAVVAWARGFYGLSLAIRVAYDTGLSPVDVRLLTLAQRHNDGRGSYFEINRAKTGKRAFATLSQQTERLLDRYLDVIGVEILATTPIIRHREGGVYSKDQLGDDFRKVRNCLWIADKRVLLDMRRTSNVEAALGGALPQDLSAKGGNTIGQSNKLFETYTPVQLAAVRQADLARPIGRRRMKGDGTD